MATLSPTNVAAAPSPPCPAGGQDYRVQLDVAGVDRNKLSTEQASKMTSTLTAYAAEQGHVPESCISGASLSAESLQGGLGSDGSQVAGTRYEATARFPSSADAQAAGARLDANKNQASSSVRQVPDISAAWSEGTIEARSATVSSLEAPHLAARGGEFVPVSPANDDDGDHHHHHHKKGGDWTLWLILGLALCCCCCLGIAAAAAFAVWRRRRRQSRTYQPLLPFVPARPSPLTLPVGSMGTGPMGTGPMGMPPPVLTGVSNSPMGSMPPQSFHMPMPRGTLPAGYY